MRKCKKKQITMIKDKNKMHAGLEIKMGFNHKVRGAAVIKGVQCLKRTDIGLQETVRGHGV